MALRLFRPFGLNTASQSRYCLWQYALHCAPPISPLRAQYGFAELRLFRPFGLNTASQSRYCLWQYALHCAPPISPLRAQYGFVAVLCARFTARIRTAFFLGGGHSRAPRALCCLPAPYGRRNKKGWARLHRGCASLTLGCVLAPFQGASFPRQICHICLR